MIRTDTDDDDYRPSKRIRADRPPATPNMDDTDGMHSSPGRSQRGNFREDVPMTDQTDDDPYDEEENDESEFAMYRVQGTLREWVTRDEVRRFIGRKFKDFLLNNVNPKKNNNQGKNPENHPDSDHGEPDYVRQIGELVSLNKCSLEIDYKQFIYIHPNLAIWLADAPQSVLEVMEEVANKIVFELHENYRKIQQKIYVRITNLPVYE